MQWGEFVYYVSSEPASYDDAVQQCGAVGAELLDIETPYESFTVARRFAGSDYGDHSMNAFTNVDWGKSGVTDKWALWIGNKVDDNKESEDEEVTDIWTYNPTGVSGLLSTLSGTQSCIYLSPRVKYNPDGEWDNDVPCSTKLHYVCRKPVSSFTPQQSQPVPVFLSLTVDCIVSPLQLNVQTAYIDNNELNVVIPYPQSCSMKGYKSSTAVTSMEIDASLQGYPAKYYIVDPDRSPYAVASSF